MINKNLVMGSFLSIALLLFLISCSKATFKKMDEVGYIWLSPEEKEAIIEEKKPVEEKEIVAEIIEKQRTEVMPHKPEEPLSRPALKKPDFIPLTEELSPLKTQIVSISARNTPLRDVLYVIADAAKLNLVIGKGVDPETPMTLTLTDVSIEDALNTIFISVDYFYSIERNILSVKAMDTRIFEFGLPSTLQTYNVDVGGDILGGAVAATEATETTEVKGSVTQNIKSDADAFTKFWASVETTIKNLIGIKTGGKVSEEDIQLQPKFTINRLTGTIVVTATKNALDRVDRYLTEMKNILSRQVLIEARIVEVQLSGSMKYGIDWTLVGEWLGVGTYELGTEKFSEVVGTTEPKFKFSITGSSFSSLLNALQQQGEVRTLSNPRINIMNGQTAVLSVGRSESFISKVESTITEGITTFTVDTSGVLSGIIVGIIPYINKNNEITLNITPIISDLFKLEDKTVGQTGANTIEISLPTVDLRELSTTTKLKNNEMVVIGGLITKVDEMEDSEVPILSKIPVLGNLFKGHSKTETNNELVIMLKPVVSSD